MSTLSTRKSYAERIKELKERQEKLKSEERDLKARQIVKERKDTTARRIHIGTVIENAIGAPVDADMLGNLLELVRQNYSYKHTADKLNDSLPEPEPYSTSQYGSRFQS